MASSMAFSRVYPCAAVAGSWRVSESQAPFQRWFLKPCGRSTRTLSQVRKSARVSQTPQPGTLGITESGEYSISDHELASQGYLLHRTLEDIDLDDLNALFVKVGFPRRQNEKLLRALEHTGTMLWISKGGKAVAFARATGDEVFNAIIWDVVVDPQCQRLGIGKAVMERLLVDLRRKGISNIVLYAEADVLGFYRSLGFVVDPDGVRAMSLSRKRRNL